MVVLVGDNLRFNQRKIIKFNHLVANMLIFHTVTHQTKAINKLRSQGVDIPTEILAGIAPYWTEYINQFGAFHLNMDKMAVNIEYIYNEKQEYFSINAEIRDLSPFGQDGGRTSV